MPMSSRKHRKGQPIHIRNHQGHFQDDRVELENLSRVNLTWRAGRAAEGTVLVKTQRRVAGVAMQ